MIDCPNANVEAAGQEAIVIADSERSSDVCIISDHAAALICIVDFKNSIIDAVNAAVQTGPGTFYNQAYGNSWLMHYPGRSFIKLQTDIENVDSAKKYSLDLFHLSSIVNGYLMDAPISIYVNGKSVVCGHNPNKEGYIHEQFDVTDFVVAGANLIEIRFDGDARTNYWIQTLALREL